VVVVGVGVEVGVGVVVEVEVGVEVEMTRERLPDRRKSLVQRLQINGQTVHFSVGLYPDGRPGEVFIDMHRTGSAVRAWCESSAKLISLMLQYGVPLSELVESLTGHCTEPFGSVPVQGHPLIQDASGVLDAIVRSMALDFLAKEGNRKIYIAKKLIDAIEILDSFSGAEIREAVDELDAIDTLDEFLGKFNDDNAHSL
jgi:hypothetical protein